MASGADNGMVHVRSTHSVDETVHQLKTILEARAVTLFAVVDHSGEAAKIGLEMRPAILLIFGNPRAGTPLMVAVPSCAIDLPLKLLVWEDEQRQVWISYNSAKYLQTRYGLPEALLGNIAFVEVLAAAGAA